MSDNPILVAQTRSGLGKGAARRAHRVGLVPAVVYGHGDDPLHLNVPGHELFLIVRGNTNALVEFKTDGKSQLALVKDVQRHPVSRSILHTDFLAVKAGEKVDVEVPPVLVGEATPTTRAAIKEHTITVKASATAVPESVEVDITGLVAGIVVRASDLVLLKGVECELDAERDIVIIFELVAEEEATPETPEARRARAERSSGKGRGERVGRGVHPLPYSQREEKRGGVREL